MFIFLVIIVLEYDYIDKAVKNSFYSFYISVCLKKKYIIENKTSNRKNKCFKKLDIIYNEDFLSPQT